MDTRGRFSTILIQGRQLFDFLIALLYTKPLLERVFSKRKEFAPYGSKFFPFRKTPFQKEAKLILTELPPPKSVPFTLGSSHENQHFPNFPTVS